MRSLPQRTLAVLSLKYGFYLDSQPFPFLAVVAVAFDDAKENVAVAMAPHFFPRDCSCHGMIDRDKGWGIYAIRDSRIAPS